MHIEDIRKNIILTSSDEFIEEIGNFFINGSFNGKDIKNIRDIFATFPNNQSKKDEDDFKYFYDKVAFVDFCKFNNLTPDKLSARKYLAAAYNPQTHEFSYSSNKFYKENSTLLNTILILNVKGKDIYKVLTSLYTCLRDNGVDNCITIPSFNRFEEGLTDSIRININAADMEKVVGLIDNLPLPIINLIDKPSVLYPRVNDYIGYDAIVSLEDNSQVRESDIVCQAMADSLCYTIMDFLDNDGKELIENGGETILNFRERCLDEHKSLIAADLRILQRMITVDPSNKDIFMINLKENLLGRTMTKSAYITKEDNEVFDEIYGKLDDDFILFESEELEFAVETPSVEVEEESILNQVSMDTQDNDLLISEEQSKNLLVLEQQLTDLLVSEEQSTDLLVPEEQSTDLLVPEEQSTDLLVPEEQSTDLLVPEEAEKELSVTEESEEQKEENLYDSFENKEVTYEEYVDSLLASVPGETLENIQTPVESVVEEAPAEETVPEVTPLERPVVEETPTEGIAPEVTPLEGPVVEEFPVEEIVPEGTPLENPIVEEAPAEENTQETVADSTPVVEDDSNKEDVHFYEESANVGENFVVSSTPAEAAPVENNSQVDEISEIVKPEDMTDEQKKLVNDTFAELTDGEKLVEELNAVLSKFPENDSNVVTGDSGEQLPQEVLNQEEVQSLVGNELDQHMTYERALKYKDLVSNISILNSKVKGTDFTLLDYFDQQQLLTRIKPEASYMTFTDEVYNGLGIVEECIIKYISNYGNVPLDRVFEEYGIQELSQGVKKDKPKGLFGLFKKKRS